MAREWDATPCWTMAPQAAMRTKAAVRISVWRSGATRRGVGVGEEPAYDSNVVMTSSGGSEFRSSRTVDIHSPPKSYRSIPAEKVAEPEDLAPGGHVVEISSGPQPIVGVSTHVALGPRVVLDAVPRPRLAQSGGACSVLAQDVTTRVQAR